MPWPISWCPRSPICCHRCPWAAPTVEPPPPQLPPRQLRLLRAVPCHARQGSPCHSRWLRRPPATRCLGRSRWRLSPRLLLLRRHPRRPRYRRVRWPMQRLCRPPPLRPRRPRFRPIWPRGLLRWPVSLRGPSPQRRATRGATRASPAACRVRPCRPGPWHRFQLRHRCRLRCHLPTRRPRVHRRSQRHPPGAGCPNPLRPQPQPRQLCRRRCRSSPKFPHCPRCPRPSIRPLRRRPLQAAGSHRPIWSRCRRLKCPNWRPHRSPLPPADRWQQRLW